MYGVQFTILVFLIDSSGFIVINREGVRVALGPAFPLVIPLTEMREIVASFLFKSGR